MGCLVGFAGARVVGTWVGCVGLAVVGELVHLLVPAVQPVIVIVAGKNTPSKLHAMNEKVSDGCNTYGNANVPLCVTSP